MHNIFTERAWTEWTWGRPLKVQNMAYGFCMPIGDMPIGDVFQLGKISQQGTGFNYIMNCLEVATCDL